MVAGTYIGRFLMYTPVTYSSPQIGNKCDLEEKRVISQEEGKAFANSIGAQFMETSAKTGYNIDRAFLGTRSPISSMYDNHSTLLDIPQGLAGEVLSRKRLKTDPTSERAGIAETRKWCVLC